MKTLTSFNSPAGMFGMGDYDQVEGSWSAATAGAEDGGNSRRSSGAIHWLELALPNATLSGHEHILSPKVFASAAEPCAH
jgi:hypothetical protein